MQSFTLAAVKFQFLFYSLCYSPKLTKPVVNRQRARTFHIVSCQAKSCFCNSGITRSSCRAFWQMTRIPRNTKTTCQAKHVTCQAVVLGNRRLHLLFWLTALKLIIQFLTSSPKRAFCFPITEEIAIRHNKATLNSVKLVNVISHLALNLQHKT